MQKALVAIFVLGFLLVFPFGTQAYSGFGFGGRITALNDNVPEIQTAKAEGYTCQYNGELIQVEPINKSGPATTYYVVGTSQKTTPHTLRTWQSILGLYFRPLAILCTKPGTPPSYKTIYLKSLTIFGTSR